MKSDELKSRQTEAPRVSILGVHMSAVNMEEALDRTEALLGRGSNGGGSKGYICVTGVHGIMEAQKNQGLRQILNDSFLSVPDGMPTVWVGRLYGHTQMDRVYGPDFMLNLCSRSRQAGYRHFLYGGNPGVADELKRTLMERYPGLRIVGTYTPPFRPLSVSELEGLQEQVTAARADIMWVGLSTPKQERFMHAYLAQLDVKLMVGVGAAFDIHTGRIKDAPTWMKQSGVQWLHRLIQEPRRLARRYLVNNPIFLLKLWRQLVGDVLGGRLRPER